jgi:Cu/Ag efflux protein CusF
MKRPFAIAAAASALTITLAATGHLALAQPAKGAAAAFERVREVMTNRFKDTRLAGDPDKDFAALLIAHHEDLIFLAKTQLEHGGDQQLRRLAQKILDEQQAQIAEVKEWQVRRQHADYRAQPDQPPHGSGPLDRKDVQAAPAPQMQAAVTAQPSPQPAASSSLPMVSGTVEKVDAGAGKITIDHGPIPNLDMDAMTMVFRTQDSGVLKDVKAGDKVQFQADRVNGQISVVRLETGRGQSAPAQAAATSANLPMVSGTIEKVDTAAGKVTIDHGPIPNLNMDAMTMVFRTQDPAVLKGVKAGDRVRFQADRVNGQISVVKIQKGR